MKLNCKYLSSYYYTLLDSWSAGVHVYISWPSAACNVYDCMPLCVVFVVLLCIFVFLYLSIVNAFLL